MKNSNKNSKILQCSKTFSSTMYVKEAINETALIQGRIQKLLQKGGGRIKYKPLFEILGGMDSAPVGGWIHLEIIIFLFSGQWLSPHSLCKYVLFVLRKYKKSYHFKICRTNTMFNPLTDPPGYFTAFSECLAGAIFFPCVFITIQYILQNSWIGRQICRLYSLKNHGVYDISNKLTSSVFAILGIFYSEPNHILIWFG